jgi:hypothetical protein
MIKDRKKKKIVKMNEELSKGIMDDEKGNVIDYEK